MLSYLKLYIRTEEKDRLHTVNRYEHLRDTDPEEAARVRDSLVRHLQLIDERITEAVNMLDRNQELKQKIRPEIGTCSSRFEIKAPIPALVDFNFHN